jgi:hypothetical protein
LAEKLTIFVDDILTVLNNGYQKISKKTIKKLEIVIENYLVISFPYGI